MRFTDGNNLTGFKQTMHEGFMRNEHSGGEGAYEISDAWLVGRAYCSYVAVLLMLLCGLSFAYAEAPPKPYPPYPDVWGYELPMPAKGDSRSRLDPTKLPDGDYAFTYVKKRITRQKPEGTTYLTQFALIHFFSAKQRDITGDELDQFWKDHKRAWDFEHLPKIIFGDGSSIRKSGYAIESCSPYLRGDSIAKVDANGQIVRRVVPLVLYDEPREDIAPYPCESNELYDKDYFLRRVSTHDWTVLPLEDATFLLYSNEENLIIRLDKDFHSKSNLLNRRLFLIDWDTYQKLAWALPERDDQALNDAFTSYVLTLKEGD